MKLADVLTPAISYAQNGHPLVERANATIKTVEKMFRDHWPTSAAIYLKDGKPAETGKLFTNPALAATYTRVLKEAESVGGDRVAQIEKARKVWSQGFVAEAIDKFCRTQAVMDTSGSPHKGVLTGQDMAKWQAKLEAPLTYDYGRYTVCKPPWSQGPVTLQQLALLKGFNLDGLDVVGPDFIHLVVECSKLAYADREKFYGDPDFVEVPFPTLLSDAYNAERRKLVTDKASMELRPGSVEGFGAIVKMKPGAKLVAGMGAGEPTVGRMGEVVGDTVHFDIVDQAGNMVTATPSGGWLQSSPVIPELGFCLGTRGQMFWLEEGHPASLAPGKRPRTTLSPTLALRDGDAYLAWGSPGGDQQDQWITQFFLRHVHAGMNLQEAIDAPAWHSEHFPISFWPRTARPGVLQIEKRVPKETRDELTRRGHIDRGRAGMVGRPPHRGVEGRQAAARCGKPARHAGICGWPITSVECERERNQSHHRRRQRVETFPRRHGCRVPATLARREARRDHVHRRPERLRQDHVPALHRRPDRDQHRAAPGARQAGRRPARRRRHGVPAFRPAAVEDGF